MKKIAKILAVAAIAASSVTSSFAAQVTDGFTVKIKVNAVCFVTAGDVDFGATTEVAGTETATGAVSVRCSKNTPFSLAFDNTVDNPLTPAIEAPATSVTGNMAGTGANTDTVAYSLGLSATSGTGAGLGVPNAQSFTIDGAITAAAPALTPDDYSAAHTLYVNY